MVLKPDFGFGSQLGIRIPLIKCANLNNFKITYFIPQNKLRIFLDIIFFNSRTVFFFLWDVSPNLVRSKSLRKIELF